jgi:hypothetical protein
LEPSDHHNITTNINLNGTHVNNNQNQKSNNVDMKPPSDRNIPAAQAAATKNQLNAGNVIPTAATTGAGRIPRGTRATQALAPPKIEPPPPQPQPIVEEDNFMDVGSNGTGGTVTRGQGGDPNNAASRRRSNVVKEVEKLKKNREERRIRQAELKNEKENLMNIDPGNPNWEFLSMIRYLLLD